MERNNDYTTGNLLNYELADLIEKMVLQYLYHWKISLTTVWFSLVISII